MNEKENIKSSIPYKIVYYLKKSMDDWFLDPIIGFIFPGFGDAVPTLFSLPYIYLSLFKLHSIPLTLAIIYNMLIDWLTGMIPFYIGDIIDVFNKAYKKNYRLIVGFVEGDEDIKKDINRKTLYFSIMIAVFCMLIYAMFQLVHWLWQLLAGAGSSLYEWLLRLF